MVSLIQNKLLFGGVVVGLVISIYMLVQMSTKETFQKIKEVEEEEYKKLEERDATEQEKIYGNIVTGKGTHELDVAADKNISLINERIEENKKLQELEYEENDHGWLHDFTEKNEDIPEIYHKQT